MIKLSPAFLKQLWLTLAASLSFLIIGLVRGYSSSAIPSIETNDPHIIETSEQKSWMGAIPPLGAFLGSTISGALMQRAGRKRTLQLTSPIWVAAWLILGFAKHYVLLVVGRFITGVGVGFVLATAQVYVWDLFRVSMVESPCFGKNVKLLVPIVITLFMIIVYQVSECCDPEIRGRLGSLPNLSMSMGVLISYIAGNWLYWRYLAFMSAIFSASLFLALLPLPESPVWLQTKGLDAAASVKWLHLSSRATSVVKVDKQEKEDELPSLFTRKVFFSAAVRKPMIIGFTLLLFQQFSGIDAVIFFTVEIFRSAGSTLDAMTATIIVGLVQLLSNSVSILLVDRAGRKPLLLISAAIMCVSMASMGSAFFFQLKDAPWLGYLPIISLVLFMMGFSLGFGPLPFLLLGELFPAHYRSQLSAMGSAVNLLSMFSVIKSYHALDAVLTPAGTFWMYSIFCAIAFFFVIFVVPETKGKSLAEIEAFFRKDDKSKKEVPEVITMKTGL